jgi:hypothetical protein
VGGAAVGKELADGLGSGDGLDVGDAVAVTEGDVVAVTDERAEGLVPAVGVTPLLAVPVTLTLAVADPVVAVEEKMAGAVVDVDAEQAETATEANTVKAPQPAVVSLMLSTVPAMAVRTFMEPPRGSGRWRPCFRSGVRNVSGSWPQKPPAKGKHVVVPGQARAARRRVLENAASHKGTADGRRRQAMACSAWKY